MINEKMFCEGIENKRLPNKIISKPNKRNKSIFSQISEIQYIFIHSSICENAILLIGSKIGSL